jgi:hypothetical protein
VEEDNGADQWLLLRLNMAITRQGKKFNGSLIKIPKFELNISVL